MAAYLSAKMKRKDLEDINDDFSDFSLSSPARKIRRLDAELPPIIEDEEPEVPLWFHPPTASVERIPSDTEPLGGSVVVMEELPTISENEERAIVLFKPIMTPLIQSPSGFSVSVDSHFLSGIRNNMLWMSQSNAVKSAEDVATGQNTNECLAVVPWIPSQLPPTTSGTGINLPQSKFTGLEDDCRGDAAMDIEEDNAIGGPDQTGDQMNENLYQWQQQQQQHCMIPQPPQNTSSPLMWFQ